MVLAVLVAALTGAAAAMDLPGAPSSSTGSSAPPQGSGPLPAPSADRGEADQSGRDTIASPSDTRVERAHVTIRRGASGARVKLLQRKIRAEGVTVRIDGAYGPATVKAVKRVQRLLGLRPTGVATPTLLRELGMPPIPRAGSTKSEYLVTFPFARSVKYTYTNDFYAGRSTGIHGATDILAPHGAPIGSVTHGTVMQLSHVDNGLGGKYVWIEDPAGNWYYYAHLSSIARGLEEGDDVVAGEVIGRNGASGNASYGAPHLHLEIAKGGRRGPAINPYSHLVAVDPKR